MTQLEAARQGIVTPEMEFVAQREDLDIETIRAEVARGRLVIPANVHHLKKHLEPMGIGVATACKINANIGTSAVTRHGRRRARKAAHGRASREGRHGDGPVDGRQDRRDPAAAIIDASPVPIGTVPIYQIIQDVKDFADITPKQMLDMVEHQAKQGVDYMTIHAGVLQAAIRR